MTRRHLPTGPETYATLPGSEDEPTQTTVAFRVNIEMDTDRFNLAARRLSEAVITVFHDDDTRQQITVPREHLPWLIHALSGVSDLGAELDWDADGGDPR